MFTIFGREDKVVKEIGKCFQFHFYYFEIFHLLRIVEKEKIDKLVGRNQPLKEKKTKHRVFF